MSIKAQMDGVRGVLGKPKRIAYNVVKYYAEGAAYIRLHRTDIVRMEHLPEGFIRYTLNSNGWRTVTTKKRMNEHLPNAWGVVQERGEWYVVNRIIGHKELYYDGYTILAKPYP